MCLIRSTALYLKGRVHWFGDFFFFVFETESHCVALVDLDLLCRPSWLHRDPFASASPVTGLKKNVWYYTWLIPFSFKDIYTENR